MLEAGVRAPSFELKSLDGGKKSLEDILASGPALLAFYKVSCPVCQLAFPYLERLAGGTSLQLIAISQDDDSTTKSFNQRFGVTFPTLLDQFHRCRLCSWWRRTARSRRPSVGFRSAIWKQ
jgi:peroxiredoxin